MGSELGFRLSQDQVIIPALLPYDLGPCPGFPFYKIGIPRSSKFLCVHLLSQGKERREKGQRVC